MARSRASMSASVSDCIWATVATSLLWCDNLSMLSFGDTSSSTSGGLVTMTLARRVAPWSRICSLVDTPSLVDAAFLIRDIVFDAVALRAPSGIGDLLRFDGEERGVRKERDPSLDILRWRSPAILSFGDLRLSSPGATPPPAETIFKGDKGCAGGATPPKLSGDTDVPSSDIFLLLNGSGAFRPTSSLGCSDSSWG